MNFNSIEKKIIKYFKKMGANGILLTGSYATNTQTETSDIDIRFILDKEHTHTIKGIKYIDDYKISYFGENSEKVKRRMSIDFSRNSRFEARLYTLGKNLYDRDGNIEEIIQYAKIFMENEFQKKLTNDDIILNMYSLHISYQFLSNLSTNHSFYTYNYISLMKAMLVTYSYILNYEVAVDIKLNKILCDSSYCTINQWKEFPDQIFIELWIKSINKIKRKNIETVYKHLKSKILNIEQKNFEAIYRGQFKSS